MDKCFDLELHKWAVQCRVSPMLAVLAQDIAFLAPGAYALMMGVRSGDVDKALPRQPDGRSWLSCYRRHRAVMSAGSPFMRDMPMVGEQDPQAVLDWARALSTKAKKSPKTLSKMLRKEVGQERLRRFLCSGNEIYRRWYCDHLRKLYERVMCEDEDPEDLDKMLFEKPETYFYARVALPCMIAFAQSPYRLFRLARLGDPTAIEMLVRVDPLVVREPRIWDWFHGATGETRVLRKRMLGKWIEEGINGRLTPTTITQAFAGIVSVMSESLNYRLVPPSKLRPVRLTAMQIRGLFDAAAMDRRKAGAKRWGLEFGGKSEMHQAALRSVKIGSGNIYNWSWAAAIKRARKQWAPLVMGRYGQKSG